MSTSAPRVSLCVPTYRRGRFLRKTIASALAQTVTDLEVVVVDDLSPDDTPEVMRGFTDSRVRYLRNEKNLGVPENLNRVFSLARGDNLALLEDHDLIAPTYVAETLSILERHPKVGFVATGIITIDEQDRPKERYVHDFPEVMPSRKLLKRLLTDTTCPFSVTTVIRRELITGGRPPFDSKFGWYADQDLWMRLAAQCDFGYVAAPLLKMRVREADHFLTDKVWESLLCLDSIHRENWSLLHPGPSFPSRWDWAMYEARKTWLATRFRANRMFVRQDGWFEHDRVSAKQYLSGPTSWLVESLSFVPRPLGRAISKLYLARWRRHHRVDLSPA